MKYIFRFNGPFVVVISYLSEMHTANMRAKILLYTSAFYSIGNISLPLIAWAIIPNDWPITIIEGVYGKFHFPFRLLEKNSY